MRPALQRRQTRTGKNFNKRVYQRPTIVTTAFTMQRFQVPQFITVEDKIIGGFLTAKQFVYVAAGKIFIVIIFFSFAGFLALFLAFLVGASAAALAWGTIDGRPIPILVVHAILFFLRPHVFVWKRAVTRTTDETELVVPRDGETVVKKSPKLSHSRLSELSWTLDTKLRDDIVKMNPVRSQSSETNVGLYTNQTSNGVKS